MKTREAEVLLFHAYFWKTMNKVSPEIHFKIIIMGQYKHKKFFYSFLIIFNHELYHFFGSINSFRGPYNKNSN